MALEGRAGTAQVGRGAVGSRMLEEWAPQWSGPRSKDLQRSVGCPGPEPGLSLSPSGLLLHPLVLKQMEACGAESMRTHS